MSEKWELQERLHGFSIHVSDDFNGRDAIWIGESSARTREEHKRIARLIAAAPEMAEALKYAYDCLVCGCTPDAKWIASASSALKKAGAE